MAKIKATAVEISKEIQERINKSNQLDGDCKECHAPTPSFTEPDTNNGCNWTYYTIPGLIEGCLPVVKQIIRSVMDEYELV